MFTFKSKHGVTISQSENAQNTMHPVSPAVQRLQPQTPSAERGAESSSVPPKDGPTYLSPNMFLKVRQFSCACPGLPPIPYAAELQMWSSAMARRAGR